MADGKSLLSRIFRTPTPIADRKPICSGAQTGYQCAHYWPTARFHGSYKGKLNGELYNFDADPELHRLRHCTLAADTRPLPADPQELPRYCARYVKGQARFDPLFEVPPPTELDMGPGVQGAAGWAHSQAKAQLAMAGEHTVIMSAGPNMPKIWDNEPGAPVLPRQPGDAPDAPARRGFTHLEVEDKRTACGVPSVVLCAVLIPGDLAKTVAQVNCPGCLAARATNVGIDTIVKAMADRAMQQLQDAVDKVHNDEEKPDGF